MAPRWSSTEDGLLRQLYARQHPVEDIAGRIGRSPDAVVARRSALAIPARPRWQAWQAWEDSPVTAAGSPAEPRLRADRFERRSSRARQSWEEWEDAALRDGYTSALTCVEIARRLPGRTPRGVAARARRLGIASYARRWSATDDQWLVRLFALEMTTADVALQLGRTPEAVRSRAARMGMQKPRAVGARSQRRRWTPEEDELLHLHAALNPARLAALLDRSDMAVCRRLRTLSLRTHAQRSPHYTPTRPRTA